MELRHGMSNIIYRQLTDIRQTSTGHRRPFEEVASHVASLLTFIPSSTRSGGPRKNSTASWETEAIYLHRYKSKIYYRAANPD